MVITPFGDNQARGDLAGSVIYQRRRGQVICKKYARPHDPHSPDQLDQRQKFLNAVSAWNALPVVDRDYWNFLATGKTFTGYNLFISRYLFEHKPSTTPLVLQHIENLHITTTRGTTSTAWWFYFLSYPGSVSICSISDNFNHQWNYTNPLPAPSFFRIDLYPGHTPISVEDGDTLELTFDGSQFLLLWLPEVKQPSGIYLYFADDGSSYYDPALTLLAKGAP